MRTKSILYYLAVGFLIMGIFLGEAEARRKILRGRKTITRRYYRAPALPAWSIAVLIGLSMLIVGAAAYFVMKKLLIDSIEVSEVPSYQPAMQDEV
ncbi:uncharacterized protein LOC131663765 [Phymastichus coffea]|uniref:uncharacterized protein LOC131663765 n=1 Tax=Phymastichus coffea TaxID=108790 RepID=UPI00273C2201|nr:uncharacterized protein LOC131663765 [Phymastichus coffea]